MLALVPATGQSTTTRVRGQALAAGAAKVLSGVLYGVNAAHPVAFMVAPAVLLLVALVAAWLPARSVTRIHPVLANRGE
jgi:ABC-type antimicrobial peptide transport system permease subunit